MFEKGLYYGEWDIKSNKPHGFGILIWNWKLFEGYLKDGKPEGVGRLYSIRSKKLYSVDEGMFWNGLHDGYGEIFWENGHHYCGEFTKDKKEGLGIYKFEDGDLYMGSHHDSLF